MRFTMPSRKPLVLVALVGGAVALDVACTDIPLTERPCPCLDGYICCDAVCELGSCSSSKKKTTSASDDDDSTSETGSQVKMLTTGNASPECIAADPTTVFWMNDDGIVAAGSTVSGKNVTSRINPPVKNVGACSLLRAGEGLYVAAANANAIQWLSVSTDGATPVVGERAVDFATFNHPVSLAQDNTYLYALDGATGEVRRLTKLGPAGEGPEDGGGGTVSDAGIPDGGTVASAGTLLGTGGTDAHSLIVVGDMLYWLDRVALRRVPKAGGPVSTLASIPGGPSELHAGPDALYWVANGEIVTLPLAGGVAHPLPYTPLTSSTSAAATKQYVYSFAVSDRGLFLGHDRRVGLVGFQGGTEISVFTSDVVARGLIIDTSRFIWISEQAIYYRPLLESDPQLASP
jgi:hypothetical protein